MKNKDIIGGVTPLKKRSQKFKAGDVGKKATSKNVKLKTGFQRSGMESKGGRNYESLTQGTRLTSSLADTLKFNQPAQPKYGGSSTFGEVPEVTVDDILGEITQYKEEDASGKEKKVYPPEEQVCHPKYFEKYGKGGPGSKECKEYKEYREKNPKETQHKSEGGKKYERTCKTKNGKIIEGSCSAWKEVT
jgi:hypothetical protein